MQEAKKTYKWSKADDLSILEHNREPDYTRKNFIFEERLYDKVRDVCQLVVYTYPYCNDLEVIREDLINECVFNCWQLLPKIPVTANNDNRVIGHAWLKQCTKYFLHNWRRAELAKKRKPVELCSMSEPLIGDEEETSFEHVLHVEPVVTVQLEQEDELVFVEGLFKFWSRNIGKIFGPRYEQEANRVLHVLHGLGEFKTIDELRKQTNLTKEKVGRIVDTFTTYNFHLRRFYMDNGDLGQSDALDSYLAANVKTVIAASRLADGKVIEVSNNRPVKASRRRKEDVLALAEKGIQNYKHSTYVPRCFKWSNELQRFIEDQQQADIYREVFRLAGTMGNGAIAQHLNSTGAKTYNGNGWTVEAIRNILRNDAVTGTLTIGKRKFPGFLPALVSHEIFIKGKTRKNKRLRNPAS